MGRSSFFSRSRSAQSASILSNIRSRRASADAVDMPPPPKFGGPPVTNIRNTSSPHWRAWMQPESRCLVPFNSFAEYAPEANPETKKKDVVWFALNDDRPLAAFAGIWTEFRGDRGTKSKPVPGPHLVYGFLLGLSSCKETRFSDLPKAKAT
jgi:putative SOS response-associated peptidase YedK